MPNYEEVRYFCLFIGYPRSGSSLLGALLDAHPNMVVSHELNVLGLLRSRFCRYDQRRLFTRILDTSRKQAAAGRKQSGYSYALPNACQGTYKRLNVVGDKKACQSAIRILRDPRIFDRLKDIVGIPVKVVHPVRNPFDNIVTICRREGRNWWEFGKRRGGLDGAIRFYFDQCTAGVLKARSLVQPQDWHTVHHDDLLNEPESALKRLCEFLGEDAPKDYIEQCRSLLYKSPHKTRYKIRWTQEQLQEVTRRMYEVDYLQRY